MPSRQKRPAVRRPFLYPQFISRFEATNHRFVVHPHVRSSWKSESRLILFSHISTLHAEQLPIHIPVRYQQRWCIIKSLSKPPARHRLRNATDSTPPHNPLVNLPLVIEKMSRLRIDDWTSNKSREVFNVNGPPAPRWGGSAMRQGYQVDRKSPLRGVGGGPSIPQPP